MHISYLTFWCVESLNIFNNLYGSFYPRTPDDGRYEPFFHISIVEGDISLVLDSEALSR